MSESKGARYEPRDHVVRSNATPPSHAHEGAAASRDHVVSNATSPSRALHVGRFAPSTTGPAHPGTLLSALLCWLDIRARKGRVVLRLEDLDPERSSPARVAAMQRALEWLGLEWDAVERQSENTARFEAALDALAAQGLLYPCACTRRTLREGAAASRDHVVSHNATSSSRAGAGVRYPGTCRARALPAAGWRAADEPLRMRLAAGELVLRDESGADLSQDPQATFGDPIVRRRDGATGYALASVVDDAAAAVTRVVRGRDLAAQSALQNALRRVLGLRAPVYRHHLLLLEARHDHAVGDSGTSAPRARSKKLAKLHGAIGFPELRRRFQTAPALCGFLAHAAGLLPAGEAARPHELLAAFDWHRVAREDRVLHIGESELSVTPVRGAGV